jgi:dipeptidase D
MNVHLCKWNGGSKHNAISREAVATFAVESGMATQVEESLKKTRDKILAYYKGLESDIQISWKKTTPEPAFSLEESKKIIQSINIIPQGPIRFSPSIKDLVETSNNVAVVETKSSTIQVLMSTRSSVDADLVDFRRRLATIGHLTDWAVTLKPAYPGWKPEPESNFIAFIRDHYEKYADEIVIKAIHAGLECGIIGAKFPGMKMVAVGPTNENPHTPDERVKISTVEKTYNFLVAVVKDIQNLKV